MKSNDNVRNKNRILGVALLGLAVAISASLIVPSQMLLQADAQNLSPSITLGDTYRVRFIQVKVLNTHEGFLSGDGEYKLFGGANGKLVFLDTCDPAPGKKDCDGKMNDVSRNQVVKFPSSKFVDVRVASGRALSVAALGIEEDWEGWTPPKLPGWVATACKPIPGVHYACDYWEYISKAASWLGGKLNSNERLGKINSGYTVPNIPTGPITEKSSSGDYILTYSIQKIGGGSVLSRGQ